MSKELEALEILSDTARFGGDYGNIDRQAYLILEQALKRNEPMKPQTKTYTNGFFKLRTCSVCDTTIQEEFAYCPCCGQKLDWSDEQ